MKTLLTILLLTITTLSYSQKRVGGYTKSNGTYVAPYHRTAPNSTKNDNYSTKGNYNPYTGKWGTKNPDGGITYYDTNTASNYDNYYGSSYYEQKKIKWWLVILITIGGGFLVADWLK
jgi:hypothetical protein